MIRVVLADDRELIRINIRRLLSRSSDIEVVGEATNGAEAVHLVQELKPDVLLLDMEMPVMNGPEAAARLRVLGVPLHIIALSAYDDREYILAMKEHGASGYVLKDDAHRLLVGAIHDVVSGKQAWTTT